MNNGHPCFVANNGRIGYDTEVYFKYAPETGASVQLIWLAGHQSRAAYNAIDSLPYNTLINQELDDATLANFKSIIENKGLKFEDYFLIPIHPWQWFNKLAMIMAPDIAIGNLIFLGYGQDSFTAQQSIRTFYNVDNPQKMYTKTALSVTNMGFMRGLSPYYMDSTPPITDWIKEFVGEDPYLKDLGFTMLCEVATVGYRNAYFESIGPRCAYNKMLAALWRESPESVLESNQNLMTMAALLHEDADGNALLPILIDHSSLAIGEWLKEYLNSYLKPLHDR